MKLFELKPLCISTALCIFLISGAIASLFAQEEKGKQVDSSTGIQLQLKAGQQLANEVTVTSPDGSERGIKFWVYLPSNYEEIDALPCMMFLHGMGERGDDLEMVKKWGPPKLIAEGKEFPFIVISPLCPKDITWQTTHLEQILDIVVAQTKCDQERVYLTGLSMGGYGTWAMLAACPERIAAAVPVCGGGNPDSAAKMVGVPIWAFHGDADTVVNVKRSRQMVEAVNAAGGSAKFKVYEGVGHNSWSETYANQAVYDWMLEHRRVK